MNLLLDTDIAIWAVADDPRLSAEARALMLDPAAQLTTSTASLWGIAIQHSRHGVKGMPISAATALGDFQASGYTIAPVTPAHVCCWRPCRAIMTIRSTACWSRPLWLSPIV